MEGGQPWQLRIFQKTLKKRMKLKHLVAHLGNISESDRCLLITCGDNNGAINYYLRAAGGKWTWVEMEDDHVPEIEQLLKEQVVRVDKSLCRMPFPDSFFACTVVVDSHEHLQDPSDFNVELSRITRRGGKVVVSVPNGDERKVGVKIKNLVGMTKDVYGHVVTGYEVNDLRTMLNEVKLKVYASKTYSKFFTESLELVINFVYVKILAKRSKAKVQSGTIAPTSEEQLKSVSKTLRLYSMAYPIFWMISKLDALLFFTSGYAVVVAARRQ